ncbi:hypothetical protein [Hymenobacter coccineus]|uniref:hypothetical protein n=1 Tax=Hymenobacter coccineus TaxID=1908235 RepID=UPI000F7AF592|nr:hypothetical protein [Hymenobacter coccineus]
MYLNQDQIRELDLITREALDILYLEDVVLLSRSGLEQSLAFRFGIYFHSRIKDVEWLSTLDLDMEYSKNGNDPKRTPTKPNGSRPDLILHSRENNDNNVLIIEFKGWWNSQKRSVDRNKILDFTNFEGDYIYGLGILIEFKKNRYVLELIQGNSTLNLSEVPLI